MKIAITGHRPNKLGNDYNLKSPLIQAITSRITDILIKSIDPNIPHNEFTLISGMALGIDTLFAKIAVHQNIPFIAAIPFKGQERMWPQKSQDTYFSLLQKAKYIVIVDTKKRVTWLEYLEESATAYLPEKMDNRNKWMVDTCDKLIAVWDGSSGGTRNCVEYAKRQIELNNITKQVPKESVIYQSCTIDEIIRINPKDIIL